MAVYNEVRNLKKAWKSHWDSGKMNGMRTPAGESGLTARRGAQLPAKWCMAAAAGVHTAAMQFYFTR